MFKRSRQFIILAVHAWWTTLDGGCRAFLLAGAGYRRNVLPFPVQQGKVRGGLETSLQSGQSSRMASRKNRRKSSHGRKKHNSPSERNSTQVRTWRIFNIEVHPDKLDLDPNIERSIRDQNRKSAQDQFLHPSVLESLGRRLGASSGDDVSRWNVRVVRRSVDARAKKMRQDGGTGPRFVFVLDIDVPPSSSPIKLRHQPGKCELLDTTLPESHVKPEMGDDTDSEFSDDELSRTKRVIVVGAGPAGLFCALRLAREPGISPIVLERGQAVEVRGKDIGALMHRRVLHPESNYAFGEGGAGTWSDGKLTTRIGRNSVAVRHVLETLVDYGAPPGILLDGSPHLGTDNLVRLLRKMRTDLRRMGGQIHFGTKVNGFIVEDGVIRGVKYEHHNAVERNVEEQKMTAVLQKEGILYGDAVVLASGHSARDVYERLHEAGVKLEPKGFAVGFRIEHPQKIINDMQYGTEWGPSVVTGRQSTDTENVDFFQNRSASGEWHNGRLPVPSYRLATAHAYDGEQNRGVYSFCMCPGGQIVPASTNPEEVCVNGMSFSRRDSVYANSALVVTVNPDDPILDFYKKEHGVLAGIAFQRAMERKASQMGGGNLCVPVQRVTDFCEGRASTSAPPSSYRLSVRPSACHEIYPVQLTTALRYALVEDFDKQMPGYVCDEGLLHAVETRTSSPVRVSRDEMSLQAIGIRGLFPAGEGAGFAGGIVSAAVDGMVVAEAVLDQAYNGQRRSATASRNTENFY